MSVEGAPATQESREGPASGGALPATGFLLLAGLTLFWGLNWPFMKLALSEIPVWTFRTICLFGGGGGLLLITRLGGRRVRPRRREILPLVVCAVFNVIGWHLFSGYGVSLMEAGRASIIAFTMPVWAALLSVPVLGEAFSWRKGAALILGMASLMLLIGPDAVALGRAPLGALCMLGAALTWAIGTVAYKKVAWDADVTMVVGWQLLIGALPISLGMMLIEGGPAVAGISSTAWMATAYILLFPMLFCQWAYFSVVRLFPASIAAIGTLMIPVLGVLSSALMLDESVGFRELLALLLVCSALAVVLIQPRRG